MARHRHRIIVEGLDGSGKTTLISHLVGRFPELVIIPGMGPDADYNVRIPQMLDEEEDGRPRIHDRFFFSELVYGPILRGRILIDPTLLNNVVWLLRSTALLIYARPHSDQLKEVVARTPQMMGVPEHWFQLLEAYDHIMAVEREWFGDRFLQYVWHRENEYALVEATITRYLRS